jgi:hypothetical protein
VNKSKALVNMVVAISSILLHTSTLSCTKKNTEKLFSIMTGIILMIPLSAATSTAIDSQLSLGLQTSLSPRCIPLTIEEEYLRRGMVVPTLPVCKVVDPV